MIDNNRNHKDCDLVKIADFIPEAIIDLKYAGTENFTRKIIYNFSKTDAFLRYGTIKKLIKVQKLLKEKHLKIMIWDAFRPVKAQFYLWEACPNPTFVADPNKGFSTHSKGNTVDITLADIAGNELKMPTGYDDFITLISNNIDAESLQNAQLLKNVMTSNGFIADADEWWHFTDEIDYPVEIGFCI